MWFNLEALHNKDDTLILELDQTLGQTRATYMIEPNHVSATKD